MDADLWLLNSCTVKGPSEDSFINAVRSGRKLNKKIVVAGCVPQGQRNHRDLDGLSVVGVQQIDRVVEVVEETLKGNFVPPIDTFICWLPRKLCTIIKPEEKWYYWCVSFTSKD